MRRLDLAPVPTTWKGLEAIAFKSLYAKEIYDAPTDDGWVLRISRYRPKPQRWEQPIFGAPLLLVPGWSQNRHAFTCGAFVKQLLAYGADVHILELRGHGKSSRKLQSERGLKPADLEFGWDLDGYFLHDVPAGVQAVKRRTGRRKIVFVGASMGGMLGYGYAGCHDDLAGLVTIGAPSDLGRGFLGLRALALLGPAVFAPVIDALCRGMSGVARTRHGAAGVLRRVRLERLAERLSPRGAPYRPVRFDYMPMDAVLRALAGAATEPNLRRFQRVARSSGFLLNPARIAAHDLRWLLAQGGEKEPRRVVEQFARWIRSDEMKCYRTGYDYKAHFKDIRVPMAIFFGDMDKIASWRSTRGVREGVRSDYLVCHAVKENSHLLTVGPDVHQICAEICELVEHAARRTILFGEPGRAC